MPVRLNKKGKVLTSGWTVCAYMGVGTTQRNDDYRMEIGHAGCEATDKVLVFDEC